MTSQSPTPSKMTTTTNRVTLESMGHGISAPAILLVNGQRVGRPLPPKIAGGVRKWLEDCLSEVVEAARPPTAPRLPPLRVAEGTPTLAYAVDAAAVEEGRAQLAAYRARFHGGPQDQTPLPARSEELAPVDNGDAPEP